jgi:hypothetical protein
VTKATSIALPHLYNIVLLSPMPFIITNKLISFLQFRAFSFEDRRRYRSNCSTFSLSPLCLDQFTASEAPKSSTKASLPYLARTLKCLSHRFVFRQGSHLFSNSGLLLFASGRRSRPSRSSTLLRIVYHVIITNEGHVAAKPV